MTMNSSEKDKLTRWATANLDMLRNLLKTGSGRGTAAKEENYREVLDYLNSRQLKNREDDVRQAAAIIAKVMGRELEVQKPPEDNGAARKLLALKRDSSGVSAVIGGVEVHLDIDQMKHQDASVPIGTRVKGGGNRFVSRCDKDWHEANTMIHMADWANGLGEMAEGRDMFHGQAEPVGGIHYEGFCLMAGRRKYVLFHCYPANSSALKQ